MIALVRTVGKTYASLTPEGNFWITDAGVAVDADTQGGFHEMVLASLAEREISLPAGMEAVDFAMHHMGWIRLVRSQGYIKAQCWHQRVSRSAYAALVDWLSFQRNLTDFELVVFRYEEEGHPSIAARHSAHDFRVLLGNVKAQLVPNLMPPAVLADIKRRVSYYLQSTAKR